MAKQNIKVGFVDYTTLVFIPDPASTDGSGKTGLVAANLTVSGTRVETDNDVIVTDYTSSLNDLAALTTAHTDWGVKEVSSTLAPGLYRLDIADALFASGAWSAVVYVMVTTSAAAASPMEFILVGYDQNDGVRMGLTALPNAAADAAGGLIISDAGGLDADAQRTEVAAILVDTGTTLDGRIPAALVGGRMDASAGALAANVLTAAATAADFTTEVTAGLSTLDAAGARAAVGLASANLDAQIAALAAYIDTEVAAIKAKTDSLPADPADASDVAAAFATVNTTLTLVTSSLATLATYIDTEVEAIKAKTDALPADPADASNIAASFATITTSLASIAAYIDTEVAAIKAKTDSLPADPADASDIAAALAAGVSVTAIAGDANAATHLKRAVLGTVIATVGAGSSTTSIVTSSMTPAAAVTDQFQGRIITFDKDTTTTALRGQATDISASTAGGVLTVTALTTAPVSGDTFTIQ